MSVATSDHYDLNRFVDAQRDVYDQALAEIKAGRKRSHWMWFIFPQYQGLGASPTSRHFAIKSLDEARAYLDHPVLGPRLLECADALLRLPGDSASEVLGYPDDLKLRSSATLFAAVTGTESAFLRLLDKFFSGSRDDATVRLLSTATKSE